MVFIDVIVPVPLPGLFTYFAEEEIVHQLGVGKRVVVKFGRGKLYTAIIHTIHNNPPKNYQAKAIDFVLDDFPIVDEVQLKMWEWISSYYMCSLGEVMGAALPSGFKLVNETKVLLNETQKTDLSNLNDKEYLVAEALQIQPVLSLDEISNILGIKSIHKIIKSLYEKNIIVLEDEIKEKYSPKIITFVDWNRQNYPTKESLNSAFELLKSAPKQQDLLLQILGDGDWKIDSFKIKRSQLIKKYNSTSPVVNGLVKKGVFTLTEEEEGRLSSYVGKIENSLELNQEQENAFQAIKKQFEQKDSVLLHGVTGSGKTEVYTKLIMDALAKGERVLYLLPEIALTTQIIKRLQRVFGDKVGVYHSKFNLNERVELWNEMLNPESKYKVILGARSSLFLPLKNLGLIIVDEEHENTFKQFDPAPRYHGRDLALVLSKMHKAKVLLGSATPSVESYFNAKTEKYGLVELTKRYGGIQLPEVQCGDLKGDKKKKRMVSLFTELLKNNMDEALEKGEQIILFQNRRGFAPMLECFTCGHIQQCKRCDVSLTYHKHSNLLRCHYCGYTEKVELTCTACGSVDTNMRGFGTEKIEEEVKKVFPKARVARMDLDTTRGKNSYQNLISKFEDKEVDILVGTQMVSKGLDFNNVSLVGVLNADQMLYYPDFRAFERAYQLMAQVSGRAGRKYKRGKVIIQSHNPHHNTIRDVMDNDYLNMYNSEILNRRNFLYPPFYRLIYLTFRHKERDVLDACCDTFASNLKSEIGNDRVLGPEYPGISRINNLYNKKIMIKAQKSLSIVQIKSKIKYWIDVFKKDSAFKYVRITVDVDPQ
ncbi:MAG: primosomal protein N' [Flavobacteriales bacterium]|nr:primosomal protein N' [Flavobacteriales bacterium]|tara:strand:- start:1450 stop:3912 length:2463 start_codon:yes stop_codon:yes gene_type:complete